MRIVSLRSSDGESKPASLAHAETAYVWFGSILPIMSCCGPFHVELRLEEYTEDDPECFSAESSWTFALCPDVGG
ncbi:hypothetical protein ACHAWF_013642, partial [Thalassiosira exigua]